MSQKARKLIGLLCAIILYYIIHEGAHLVASMIYGTFESIRIVGFGLGVQVVANTGAMTNMPVFIMCIVGPLATLAASYLLVWQSKAIVRINSKMERAIFYYTTLVFLLLDPVYLSVIHNFVGGGDMNGITGIGISTVLASVVFGVIAICNLIIFIKAVLPKYKVSFAAG